MKALNYQEVTKIVEVLNKILTGARLQKAVSLSNGMALEFYSKGQAYHIYIELGQVPFLWMEESKAKLKKHGQKPIEIFLKSHFVGSICRQIVQPEVRERYLQFDFGEAKSIQVQLAPNAKNISAYSESKSIHFKKPVELSKTGTDFVPESVRDYESLKSEYLESRAQKPKASISKDQKAVNKRLQKRQQDIQNHHSKILLYEKLKNFVESYDGDWSEPCASIPKQLQKIWDKSLPVFANYDHAQEKLKAYRIKYQNAMEQLSKEQQEHKTIIKKPQTSQPYKKVDVATRKLEMTDGKQAFVGKSAKDNLLLLRNAKPWFIWMHLKDLPGSHVIITRNKNQNLSDSELYQVAHWLITQQYNKKKQKRGEKFQVIYTQCRYVKPIKGNKTGLVNYQNEKEITVKFD